MKQSLLSRRSCSVGASSILAVVAIGFAATPALAATSHTTVVKPHPRMNSVVAGKRGEFHTYTAKPHPRMN